MAYIIVESERIALQIGENILGGSADEVLAIPPLAALPPFAKIEVLPDDDSRATALPGAPPALLNGAPLTEVPRPLAHGARIECGALVILYGDLRTIGSTASIRGVRDDDLALLAGIAVSAPTADTGGRLVTLDGGATHPIPERGLLIGREPTCDIVLASREVSRRHASIKPSLQGYLLSDTSANGVYVNGARVRTAQILGQGDVVRIGDDEFRFEADPAPPDLVPPSTGGTESSVRSAPAPAAAQRAPLLATLELLNAGTAKGTRFRIERPIVQIGRGAHNDVRLQDDSVSGSHATLLLRDGAWHLLDLGSTNGSYVDGERVGDDVTVRAPAELRFGNLKLLFRVLNNPVKDTKSTRGIVGVRDEQLGETAPTRKQRRE